jgi:hypothetical protein
VEPNELLAPSLNSSTNYSTFFKLERKGRSKELVLNGVRKVVYSISKQPLNLSAKTDLEEYRKLERLKK